MPTYDAARFDPPAPLAPVNVKSEQLGIVANDVPMLLDTGADVTLLPRFLMASRTLQDPKEYELQAFDGSKTTAPAITAELQFLGKSFRGQFLLIESWHGVLGRNVLHSLSLLLDGPTLQWLEQR